VELCQRCPFVCGAGCVVDEDGFADHGASRSLSALPLL
jgi:hypothetical protein